MNTPDNPRIKLSRRNALGSIGSLALIGYGTGAALSAPGGRRGQRPGNGGSSSSSSSSSSTTSSASSSASSSSASSSSTGSCVLTPTETQGPYPLYSAVVSNTALWRQNITEGKTGIPLNLILRLVDVNNGCAPLAGHDIYVWHCDKDGLYSGYSNSQNAGQAGLTYLRGVQTTDDNGQVLFSTIYPGWYPGRITHVHFRVFLSSSLEATSQLCFPQDITAAVYGSSLYTKGQNTSVSSFAADNVFSDGTSYQMCSMSGSLSAGYSAALTIGINS